MYCVTFDILRRSSAILTEEPGRWSNRYLHCGLNDVTATKKRDEMGLTRELHGSIHRVSCVKIRASFHRESRLRSTFFKDGVHSSLHFATANTISALLSSGARATGLRNGARNAHRNKENIGRTAGKLRPLLATIVEIFLFDTQRSCRLPLTFGFSVPRLIVSVFCERIFIRISSLI